MDEQHIVDIPRSLHERWCTNQGFRFQWMRSIYSTFIWMQQYYSKLRNNDPIHLPGTSNSHLFYRPALSPTIDILARIYFALRVGFVNTLSSSWCVDSVLTAITNSVLTSTYPKHVPWFFTHLVKEHERHDVVLFVCFWAHGLNICSSDVRELLAQLHRTKLNMVHKWVHESLPPCLHPLVSDYFA